MEILLQKLSRLRWWAVVKDGLRRRYETSMQLLKSITCSSWACRGSTEFRRSSCGYRTYRSGRWMVNHNFAGSEMDLMKEP